MWKFPVFCLLIIFFAGIAQALTPQEVLDAIATQIGENLNSNCVAPQLENCDNNKKCNYTGDCGGTFYCQHNNDDVYQLFVRWNVKSIN